MSYSTAMMIQNIIMQFKHSLEDDELCKIWNIIEIAMNREGYDVSNSELSMRLYDR